MRSDVMKNMYVSKIDKDKQFLENDKLIANSIDFDAIEDYIDSEIISNYEKKKREHTLELMDIDDVWQKLDINMLPEDSFYAKSNINAIEHSINQAQQGKVIIKTIDELLEMENE